MPSMEQLSNQAPYATYKNATDKKPAIVTRGMPVLHAGLFNSGRRLSGKMIGKKTRNRKLPKQGVPICQSPLAKSAVRPPRIAENKRKQELLEKRNTQRQCVGACYLIMSLCKDIYDICANCEGSRIDRTSSH